MHNQKSGAGRPIAPALSLASSSFSSRLKFKTGPEEYDQQVTAIGRGASLNE
jgi:hypothetical protein